MGTTLLVASTGGHIEQLLRLRERLSPAIQDAEWVTADDPQTRSLLQGERVHFMRYVAPRHGHTMVANIPAADEVLRHGRFDQVVTTGAAMAMSVLLPARARHIACHWIESSARAAGPSLTGRMAAQLPGLHLYAQYPCWAHGRWHYRGSVFDDYCAGGVDRCREQGTHNGGRPSLGKVVITLGTMRTYGFRRAIEAINRCLPPLLAPDAEVVWQTGHTDLSGLNIDGRISMPAAELHDAVRDADLVIAHAGVGSALTALDHGRVPVLLPRRKAHGEHVDDHQLMIAAEMDRRALAVSADPDDLTSADLERASLMSVRLQPSNARFELDC